MYYSDIFGGFNGTFKVTTLDIKVALGFPNVRNTPQLQAQTNLRLLLTRAAINMMYLSLQAFLSMFISLLEGFKGHPGA